MQELTRLRFAAVTALFLASGAAALTYEVLWFKELAHVWGSTSLAMALVVASFLTGLGLGALLLGPIADRIATPFRGYALCELGIALFAILVPYELALLQRVAAELHPFLRSSPLLGATARFVATLLVLGPPSFLMGGTLPFAIRQLAPPGRTLGATTSWLYAVNTIGAAGGAFLAGFFLLPAFGQVGTGWLAVAVNVAVGLGALVLAPKLAGGERVLPSAHVRQGSTAEPTSWKPMLAAAAATGWASIALQVLWSRELALLLGGTTYAFTAMLSVFILGIGVGSLLFRVGFVRLRSPGVVVAGCIIVIAVSTLVGRQLEPTLARADGNLIFMRGSLGFNAALCSAVSACMELVPTLAMGALFPALVELARRGRDEAGRTVGALYAWNTAGAVGGALTTGLLVLPALGTDGGIRLVLAIYALAALLLIPASGAAGRGAHAAAAVGALVLPILPWPGVPPLATNLGMYVHGAAPAREAAAKMELVSHAQGTTADVAVVDSFGIRSLRINGKVDGTDRLDMPTQLGLAYLPRLLRPQARNVLVIGFGTGCSTGAMSLFPDTRVTCVEIEREVVRASPYFHSVNHSPELSPRVDIRVEDGRSHVQGCEEEYDILLSAPSNPWVAGISNLFTREFYAEAATKLAPGGILAQWIQIYSITGSEYAAIVRTVREVFPECAVLRISAGDTLLIASSARITPSAAGIDAAQALVDSLPEVALDLRTHFGGTDVASLFLGSLLLDSNGTDRLVAARTPGPIYTDRDMRLEFEAPLTLYDPRRAERDDPQSLLWSVVDPAWFGRCFAAWGCDSSCAAALARLHAELSRSGSPSAAALADDVARLVLEIAPNHPFALVQRILLAPDMPDAEWRAAVEALVTTAPEELQRVCNDLAQRAGRSEDVRGLARARDMLQRMADAYPKSATILASLAVLQLGLGAEDEARRLLDQALELDPVNAFGLQARRTLESPLATRRASGKDSRETQQH